MHCTSGRLWPSGVSSAFPVMSNGLKKKGSGANHIDSGAQGLNSSWARREQRRVKDGGMCDERSRWWWHHLWGKSVFRAAVQPFYLTPETVSFSPCFVQTKYQTITEKKKFLHKLWSYFMLSNDFNLTKRFLFLHNLVPGYFTTFQAFEFSTISCGLFQKHLRTCVTFRRLRKGMEYNVQYAEDETWNKLSSERAVNPSTA